MPYFHFDLVIDEEFKGHGGMILEDTEVAFERAESLASQLSVVRPDLRSRGCAVRVTDYQNRELYRTPLDPILAWVKTRRRGLRDRRSLWHASPCLKLGRDEGRAPSIGYDPLLLAKQVVVRREDDPNLAVVKPDREVAAGLVRMATPVAPVWDNHVVASFSFTR
jgi:hypothetical protein